MGLSSYGVARDVLVDDLDLVVVLVLAESGEDVARQNAPCRQVIATRLAHGDGVVDGHEVLVCHPEVPTQA